MTSGQHKKYELEKSIVRNAILSTIEKEGVAKSSIVILQGLTRCGNWPTTRRCSKRK
jgi:hypothetical protein